MSAGDTCDGCFRTWEELDALSEAEDGGWYCGECLERLRWVDDEADS